MTNITIIENDIDNVITTLNGIVIRNNDDEKFAVDFARIIKTQQKMVKEAFDPIVEKAHQTHKEATTQRSKYLNPLLDAESKVKKLINDYRDALERERLKEQQRIKLEQERLLEEERKRIMAQAEQALASGDENKAEDLAVKAVSLELGGILVAPTTVKQEGMSRRTVWKARVIDIDLIPRKFMVPDLSLLNAFAKENWNRIPVEGVEFYEEGIVSLR